MPVTVININNAVVKSKMASFDYDWTLVNPKDGKTFPSSVDDWMWLYPSVPEKLKQYHAENYTIVVFTNQSKTWKHAQIQLVMETLKIPVFVVIATSKADYKPNPAVFNALPSFETICKDESFFVGDALGRKSDHSDCDKVFAENIGIKCYSPEEIFATSSTSIEIPIIPLATSPEIIIMVGYPGSGKTTIAKDISAKHNYIHIARDIYKTPSKMKKIAVEHMSLQSSSPPSIIFDATHSSVKSRKEIIDFARKHNYQIKCIHVTTSLDISYKRNKMRSDREQVPKIAYSVYKKYYEEPTESEGFTLCSV